LPTPNSFDSVNNKTGEAIDLLMSGKPINFSSYIIEYMAKVGPIRRPSPSPYANLLTLVFKHFGSILTMRFEKYSLFRPFTLTPFRSFSSSKLRTMIESLWMKCLPMREFMCHREYGVNIRSRSEPNKMVFPPSSLDRFYELLKHICDG